MYISSLKEIIHTYHAAQHQHTNESWHLQTTYYALFPLCILKKQHSFNVLYTLRCVKATYWNLQCMVDEQGVNPSCTDKNGLRPIDYAKNSNVREFLLHYNSRGAQADWLGPGTNTSHHHTARSSVVEVCFIDDDFVE